MHLARSYERASWIAISRPMEDFMTTVYVYELPVTGGIRVVVGVHERGNVCVQPRLYSANTRRQALQKALFCEQRIDIGNVIYRMM